MMNIVNIITRQAIPNVTVRNTTAKETRQHKCADFNFETGKIHC